MKKIRKLILPVIILGAVLSFAGCREAKDTEKIFSYEHISPEEAKRLMETEENYIILDVRTIEEYDEKHIEGAVCIPNETIGDTQPQELPDKNQLILVYCRSGNRSKQAALKLQNLGYSNVKEFGGIIQWLDIYG